MMDLRVPCAVAVLLAVGRGEACAQGALTGRVVYAPSGRAVAAGYLRIGDAARAMRLDEDGRFTLPSPPPRAFEAYVNCPVSRRLWGDTVGPLHITWDEKADTLPWIAIPDARCLEPPEVEREVEVSGLYRGAFELSSFTPCEPFGELEGTAYGTADPSAWVEFGSDVGELPAPAVQGSAGGYTEARWFLTVHGVLRGPGSFGHMGLAMYLLTVDSVLAARKPASDDCAR